MHNIRYISNWIRARLFSHSDSVLAVGKNWRAIYTHRSAEAVFDSLWQSNQPHMFNSCTHADESTTGTKQRRAITPVWVRVEHTQCVHKQHFTALTNKRKNCTSRSHNYVSHCSRPGTCCKYTPSAGWHPPLSCTTHIFRHYTITHKHNVYDACIII